MPEFTDLVVTIRKTVPNEDTARAALAALRTLLEPYPNVTTSAIITTHIEDDQA